MTQKFTIQTPKNGTLYKEIENQYKNNTFHVSIGDVIQLKYLIPEGNKERLQKIEGLVIAKKGKTINKTITVRRFVGKFGVEQIISINSPKIVEIKILQNSVVHQSKLYYLRTAKGKNAKLKRKF